MNIARVILTAVLACAAFAAERRDIKDVETASLTTECQKSAEPTEGMNLVWYIPFEFWQATFAQDKTIAAADAENMLKSLKPYLIIGVLRADISSVGAFDFHARDAVLQSMEMKWTDATGNARTMKPAEKINPDAELMLNMIKPMLTSAMGRMGEHFHFFVYEDSDGDKRLVDPYLKGKLDVELKPLSKEVGGPIRVDLPLDALYVPRTCCEKKLHISWQFCPHCGKKQSD